jgi:hypothetical protein
MTDSNDPLTPANDRFERYYTEKIWEWIPAFYRDEDGLATNPDVLRAIVEILSQQAAIARRSSDRLWEDAFIELCDDWAIPYIGDLVGTRLVNELNRRGRRVDVARTIFYRRRKGTLLVLERLLQDIAGWEGVVVESFRRLGRTRHGLDPEPAELLGPISQTPPGGWAHLKSVHGSHQVDGSFDEFAHTPDFRQLRGKLGRYNIPKLNFHLYRLVPFEVKFATPADLGNGRFTFDPSGRDIPLFRPDQRRSSDQIRCPRDWQLPQEWQLPAPIPCRLLGDARYIISTETIDDLVDLGLVPAAAEELSHYVGIAFRSEVRLRQTIASLSQSATILALFDRLLASSLSPDSPQAYLIPSPIQSDPTAIAVAVGRDTNSDTSETEVSSVEHQRIASANLADWGASLGMLPLEKTLAIDPERGRFWFPTAPTDTDMVWVPIYHYGLSGNIGAGTYDRRNTIVINMNRVTDIPGSNDPGPIDWTVSSPPTGIFQFNDSKTYLPNGDIVNVNQLILQASNFQRPYLKRIVPGGIEWVFQAEPKLALPLGTPQPDTNRRDLTLEGLWIGIEPKGTAPIPVSPDASCPPMSVALVLDGTFDRVTIRHCTLDPGGEQARIVDNQCQSIPSVQILVRGTVEELIVESSIIGPIIDEHLSRSTEAIAHLAIRDSIVHSIDPLNQPAIQLELGTVELQRVTVFGDVIVNRLNASEALIQGLVRVTDNQQGCFRFSATNDNPQKRLPPQFESHLYAPGIPNHFFVSRRLGDPGYAQLSDTAPLELVRGAENRSEIGAFSRLLFPIKLEDLKVKVNEFMPFGLIAQFINET